MFLRITECRGGLDRPCMAASLAQLVMLRNMRRWWRGILMSFYLRHWADSLPFLPVPKSRSFSCVTALYLQTLSNGHPISSVSSGSAVILRILWQLSWTMRTGGEMGRRLLDMLLWTISFHRSPVLYVSLLSPCRQAFSCRLLAAAEQLHGFTLQQSSPCASEPSWCC